MVDQSQWGELLCRFLDSDPDLHLHLLAEGKAQEEEERADFEGQPLQNPKAKPQNTGAE